MPLLMNAAKYLSNKSYQFYVNTNSDMFMQKSEEGTLPNSAYEGSITLNPKPDEDIIRKENYKPISFMNIDAIISEVLANQIQQYKNKYNLVTKCDLFQKFKIGLTFKVNQCNSSY